MLDDDDTVWDEEDGPREPYECYGCMYSTISYAQLQQHFKDHPSHAQYKIRADND